MNIILSNATINNGNRGCTALAITMLYILDKVLRDFGVAYNVYLTDSQQEIGKKYVVKIGDSEVIYHTCGYPKLPSWKGNLFLLVKRLLKKSNDSFIFKHADFILDIGQGDSFSDIYGLDRFNSIDWIHKIARDYHKPYCILPQTIGPFEDDDIKQRADLSIAKASCCMARDKMSYQYVLNNVPSQRNTNEYIDVAFFLPYETIVQKDENIHVGLNISSLLWNGGYTQNNQFGLICNYQQICCEIIDFFLKQPNTKVHLIPHVVLQERDVENDYEVCYELWRKYSNTNLILAPFALGPMEIKSYIAGMDFFIGARMHATIAAFSSGVPVVPMAYSRKFNGLFVDTLKYSHIVDMKCMSNDLILQTISDSFDNRKKLKGVIDNAMNGIVKERKEKLLYDIKAFLGLL